MTLSHRSISFLKSYNSGSQLTHSSHPISPTVSSPRSSQADHNHIVVPTRYRTSHKEAASQHWLPNPEPDQTLLPQRTWSIRARWFVKCLVVGTLRKTYH